MNFETALKEARGFHGETCVGLVLGTRIAIAGLQKLGIIDPSKARNLIVFVEIDRCLADAIQAITRCTFGKRKLKYLDYGKFAATFVEISKNKALRISIKEQARELAMKYGEENGLLIDGKELGQKEKMDVMATAYSRLPEEDLLDIEDVNVSVPEWDQPGLPRHKTVCTSCGETIFDHREKIKNGIAFCRACAHGAYYTKNKPNASEEIP